jgi:hypothetical protein
VKKITGKVSFSMELGEFFYGQPTNSAVIFFTMVD